MAAEESKTSFARGDVISRKYEVESPLSRGMFGASYLARHIASGRHVVIKFLEPQLMGAPTSQERLKASFNKAKTIRHPAVVRYGEINDHNGLTYITSEHFKSQSLREVLDEAVAASQSFTLQDACQIVIKVLEALQSAHEAGVVHRNVKPENILVQTQRSGPGGTRLVRTIKLTDVGLIDFFEPAQVGDRFDSAFDSPYLAPELTGYGQTGTPQADLYSVGVIFYELLTGQPPRGTFFSPSQVREDLPAHVDQVVELALSPEGGDRYPSARDMVLDIQRAFEVRSDDNAVTPGSSRKTFIALGIGGLLVAGAAIYLLAGEKPDPLTEAEREDNIIRKQVQADNPLPDEAVVRAMLEKHKDMVYIPGGTFVQGRLAIEDRSMFSPGEPLRKVTDVPAFFIDRFEFPNRPGELPVGKTTYKEAEEACQKVSKRLCTALEWEKACKGPGNFIYSYSSDSFDPEICGPSVDDPYKLGERAECVSEYGVYDLSGGFREWTATSPANKPDRKVVKGGMRGTPERGYRCAYGVDEAQDYTEATITFRCCLDGGL